MPNQFFSPEGDLEDYFVTDYWLIDQYIGDQLWGWGNNILGALANNNFVTNISTPVTTFTGGTNWNQVSTLGSVTAAIKTDGTLWTWGANNYGPLGNATTTARRTPVTTFAGGNNWKQVSSGGTHTVAIKTDGTLWVWGRNHNGQLGNAQTTNRSTPVTTFAGGNNWKQVVANSFTIGINAAIKTDGTLWTWGSGSGGMLGNAQTTNRSTPVTTFAGGNNWKQVSCGQQHVAAIKTDGTLWVWGDNSSGQLGITNITSKSTPVTTFAGGNNWKQVCCGNASTAAIKTDGTLWLWGINSNGELGNAITTISCSTPVTTFAGGTNWKQVEIGDSASAAIKTDGTLWNWGRNHYGQLGNTQTTDRSTPVTTFAGGNDWKQVSFGSNNVLAITAGTTPDLPFS